MANRVKTPIQNYFEKTLYENGQHSHIFLSGDDTVLTVATKTFVLQCSMLSAFMSPFALYMSLVCGVVLV